jgi:transcriptional regulator with XRE-family HTH domain
MMNETLARKLRVLRAAQGITLREAEELTGVTRETLGALEHGQRGAYTNTLQKIAEGYGTTVSELLGEESVLTSPKADASQEEAGHPYHQRTLRDSISVDDTVKRTLEPQFNALINALKTNGLSEKATELERMRDEILAA